jgi:hypothetical protein
MKDCCVPADTNLIECCLGIDVRPTVEKQGHRREVAVFCGYMQKRPSLKCKAAAAGHAAIEFGEAPVDECRISVKLLSQPVESTA